MYTKARSMPFVAGALALVPSLTLFVICICRRRKAKKEKAAELEVLKKHMQKKLFAAVVDKLDPLEIRELEKKGREHIFVDELDSDGELLWKGIDLDEEARRHQQIQAGEKVEVEPEVPLYLFYKGDGLINMIDGDLNNALQSVLQVFLELDDLANYFNKPKTESLNGLHITIKKLYTLAYRPLKSKERKAINLKHIKRNLKKYFSAKRRYNAFDIMKCLI